MKSSRVGRVVQILTALQAGRSYTCADLARMFGKSRRTIFRDLQQLHSIGIPYHYDSKTGGYRIDSQFFLPPIGLNLSEALSLLLLVHKARCQIQLPFSNSALLAALKIESKLPAEIRRYCNASLRNISTRPNPQAPTNLLDRTFSQIQRAIVRRRCLAISYRSFFESTVIDLELHPYHLMYNRRAWYMLGYSMLHKNIRTFKLNRIKDVKMLEKCFTDGSGFDLTEFLGRAWSMIPEGRLYDIKLKFLPKVADNVTEVSWHSTQKVKRCEDGSAIVEFRVDGLGEIIWWILGYGDQVQVLAPALLRKKVIQTAQNMTSLNERTGN